MIGSTEIGGDSSLVPAHVTICNRSTCLIERLHERKVEEVLTRNSGIVPAMLRYILHNQIVFDLHYFLLR
jgi:hypothetical protein